MQPPKLILQPLNLLLLLGNDLQQTPHEGRLVALGNLGSFGLKGGMSMASSIANLTTVSRAYLQLMST